MKIGDFFNKILKTSENQIGTLNYELTKYREKIGNANKEIMFSDNIKYRFEKIVNIICVIYFPILVFGLGLSFFGILSSKILLLCCFLPLVIGYAGYKIIGEIINKKTVESRKQWESERSLYQSSYNRCNGEINKLKMIREQVNRTKKFFEVHQGEKFLEKKLPILESQVLQYLEKSMSLISILYLANNGCLPNKLPSSLTYKELEHVIGLSRDIDRKLNDNPMLFFSIELYQNKKDATDTYETLNKSDINGNKSTLIFSEKEVVELPSDRKVPRVRNYRSAKYRESNQSNNEEQENKGRSR